MSDSKPNCDFAVIVTNPSGSNWRGEYAEQLTAAEQAVLDAEQIGYAAQGFSSIDAIVSADTFVVAKTFNVAATPVKKIFLPTIQEEAVESGALA